MANIAASPLASPPLVHQLKISSLPPLPPAVAGPLVAAAPLVAVPIPIVLLVAAAVATVVAAACVAATAVCGAVVAISAAVAACVGAAAWVAAVDGTEGACVPVLDVVGGGDPQAAISNGSSASRVSKENRFVIRTINSVPFSDETLTNSRRCDKRGDTSLQ